MQEKKRNYSSESIDLSELRLKPRITHDEKMAVLHVAQKDNPREFPSTELIVGIIERIQKL